MTLIDNSQLFDHPQESCLLCAPERHGQNHQVILRSDTLYLFAGLGAIEDGYIIVAPYGCDEDERPRTSLADLSAAEGDELAFLRGMISSFYQERFGQPGMSFEHGCSSRSV
jgi:hypothetical protein